MNFKKLFPAFLIAFVLLLPNHGFADQQEPSNAIPTKAPFTTDATASASNSNLMGIYDEEVSTDVVPMDRPHRTTEQISTWVGDHITTAMNIDATEWDSHLKKITPDFDAYGIQEFQNYLKSSGILNLLQTNHMRINAIADSGPVLLSEGAIGGSYHWLYQMPLMITYYAQDTKTLRGGKTKWQNQTVMYRVQVGRVAKGGDDNNVVIERWSAVPVQ